MSDTYDLTYLSFGAGVQSSALLLLSDRGERGVPRATAAIFADTQSEPPWVYDHLDLMESLVSIPIYRVTAGNLGADIVDRHKGKRSRFAAIPVFTGTPDGDAMLRRQCTREYKITPIEKKVRELLGYKKGERVKKRAQALIGISLDESTRMKPSRTHWVDNRYPLVDAGLSRSGCIKILEDAGIPVPLKSACSFCPYHDNKYWKRLQDNHPEEFAKTAAFDKDIRDMTRSGVKQPVFLHRSLKPLDEVDFDDDKGQMALWDEECEGMCGV